MALIGRLNIKNNTTKIYDIFQGPRHKVFRGLVGPNSFVGFAVNDPTGNTYFRAVPKNGGANIDKIITGTTTQMTWISRKATARVPELSE
jgi:hypothetical protein